jgi:hypothetical protein
MLFDEAVVPGAADMDLFAELADFHPAVLDQPGVFAPDLIRIVRDGHAFDIDVG